MTEDVHMPLSLRHNLPIGISSGLVPLKAPYKLSEAVVLLRKLGMEDCHRWFGFQVGIGEQHRHAPVTNPFFFRKLPCRIPEVMGTLAGVAVPSCMRISSSRVTITGDTRAADRVGVWARTSLGGGVGEHNTCEHGEGDGAKRGASSIKSRSSDLGVEESEREDWVMMMNSIMVTERCVDYCENDWDDGRESLSI